ncbi:hypothetical protein H340_01239 [Streptomyces mobaraensis NBRC 13819 = DSM 40847]|uniref:Uncharacterized protein n=1 Tax=Streptomyces mobaraensis (strain ATCC 29032 / DSM 40847 / JCM 4168 / NBRC 13819 / NCIMB 11159 / IPCR 16-22) TaxID=1223523 RepID=M3B8U9_STRM1|nr:hypothetical protein H340_01239 [Streptomyces mobaraensis NBRC 13819 = DSM 40847]
MTHTRTLDDGRVGCYLPWCGKPATRWIDMERWGIKRWLTTSYCDDHGEWELDSSDSTMRERKIQ